jgi:HlyD family secretion protein
MNARLSPAPIATTDGTQRHEAGTSRRLVFGAIAFAMIALVVLSRLAQRHEGERVVVTPVRAADLRSSILASGNLAFKQTVELRPQVIGQVVQTTVEEGDHVTRGQVVVRLDPSVYEAAVTQREAAVAQQKSAIAAQRVTVANLERNLTRNKDLFAQHMVSADAFDRLGSDLQVARLTLRSQESALAQAEAELNQARENQDKTVIRAPIDGLVTRLSTRVGETVVAGTNIPGSSLMQIADPSEVLAEVDVDEADINHVHVGQTAEVHALAVPGRVLKGKVRFIRSSADTDSGHQGHMFTTRIALSIGKDLPVRPGMSCRAEIFTDQRTGVLVVPVAAVMYDRNDASKSGVADQGEHPYVMIDDQGVARKRYVRTGISDDTSIELVSGLKASDQVVTGPYLTLHHLQDGDSIFADAGAAQASATDEDRGGDGDD